MYGALAIRPGVDPSRVERDKNQRSVNIPYQKLNISATDHPFSFKIVSVVEGTLWQKISEFGPKIFRGAKVIHF